MTRLRNLRPKEVITALKRAGFFEHHQTGSHLFLWNNNKKLMTMIVMHPGDVPRPILKKIIKQSGLTEKEFEILL